MNQKNLLYIGSSGGIGQKLIPYFKDYNVIGHYHENKPPIPHHLFCADITNYQQVENMVKDIIREFNTIDIVINSAGISIDSFSHKFDALTWQKIVNVNLIGVFNTIRAVLPYMRNANYGRIINMSSIVGQKPVFGTSAYSASKSGLSGLVRTVAIENINKGITCNNIALGYFEAGLMYRLPPDIQKQIIKSIPIRRLGTIQELYNTMEFIINTEYFTGQTLNLNGGLI
jgi:NAD(P)-dependent dehydrogenase (short-subunit alcohol dehydrogenase family)